MHSQLSFYAKLFFGAALLSRFAIAESAGPKRFKPVPRDRKEVSRKLASVENGTTYSKARVQNRGKAENRDLKTGIALLMGMASVTSINEPPASPTVGLNVDFQAMKYFGAELEAFLDIPLNKAADYSRNLGFMGNLKGQLPLTFGSVRFVPKLGVGFGFHQILEFTKGETEADDAEEAASLSGPYATVGFELEPLKDFLLLADYALTVSAAGTLELKDSFSGIETELGQTKIERVRVGGYYRLTRNLRLGAQFTRRALRYDLETAFDGFFTSTPVQTQIQALVVYEL